MDALAIWGPSVAGIAASVVVAWATTRVTLRRAAKAEHRERLTEFLVAVQGFSRGDPPAEELPRWETRVQAAATRWLAVEDDKVFADEVMWACHKMVGRGQQAVAAGRPWTPGADAEFLVQVSRTWHTLNEAERTRVLASLREQFPRAGRGYPRSIF